MKNRHSVKSRNIVKNKWKLKFLGYELSKINGRIFQY